MITGRSYAVEQRLRLIDFLLTHYGVVRRLQIEDYFGITTATVSNDFALYQQLAPGNMTYDMSAKAYLRTHGFMRVWH